MKKILFSFFLFLIPILIFTQENPWILKRNKDDIEVYYREGKDSDIRELRMVYTLNGRLSSVVSLINDVPNYHNWVYKLAKAYVVDCDRVNNVLHYYNEIEFPWPLSNRDLITHSTLKQDSKTKMITSYSKSAHHKLAEKEDIVRITSLEIIWKLFPQKDGTTKIDYFLKSDPAGNIPAWMVNLALDQGPIETVKNMREELKKPKYQNAQLSYIID